MAHADTAAARLHELAAYYREHPVTGPVEGHTATVTAAAPLQLGTLDHIRAAVQEVADHTRTVNPDAGPLPRSAEDVYDWMRQHTQHADEVEQQRAEVIEYRQWLEHCLLAGDHETVHKRVRRQSCPECGCWTLIWMPEATRAVCTNTECVDRDGFSTTLSLSRLAHVHVTTRQNVRQARAT
ncbi:hypothetical protein [Streptomyces olivaceoviridis]|uniref:hypothetical protein n=1 Tax=Streptomyces olivaceoviridis TaxID=1921 RepID=UPI0036F9FE5D